RRELLLYDYLCNLIFRQFTELNYFGKIKHTEGLLNIPGYIILINNGIYTNRCYCKFNSPGFLIQFSFCRIINILPRLSVATGCFIGSSVLMPAKNPLSILLCKNHRKLEKGILHFIIESHFHHMSSYVNEIYNLKSHLTASKRHIAYTVYSWLSR